ncbi:MAG: PP2C family protein-serine/threonine phosphatase [Candidatus Limiplasma sp.]|nr:PP2C family protein-serine/threonine phosphatase [Candidatus Limiplasma sp.]
MDQVVPQLVCRASIAQTIGKRAEQQDRCRVSDPAMLQTHGLLAVLADGMGGMAGGGAFAELAVNAMMDAFAALQPTENPALDLLRCYHAAEARLPELPFEENEGGSTVVAVLLRRNTLHFLTVGDSRLYLCRGGGLIQLNREQTLGHVLDERAALGLYPWADAQTNLRRHALFNFFGAKPPKPPDRNITPISLRPDDRIVLMSDGVFGTLTDQALLPLILQDAAISGQAMIDAVLEAQHPKQDNGSVILLLCEHAEG